LNSSGQTWGAGGNYDWEINQANGTKGWDCLNIGGAHSKRFAPRSPQPAVCTRDSRAFRGFNTTEAAEPEDGRRPSAAKSQLELGRQ